MQTSPIVHRTLSVSVFMMVAALIALTAMAPAAPLFAG